MIHTIIDGDEGYVDTRKVDQLAPIGILGDSYTQYVKIGRINQVRGTLTHLKEMDGGALVTATIQGIGKDGLTTVDNVSAVIYATGFDTPSSLAFLPDEVKAILEYDPTCSPAPFILDTNFLSQNSSIPTLAIVGYPGAYWPLFEMQARAIVHAWTSSSAVDHAYTREQTDQRSKLREYYKALRKAFKEGRKEEVPHNPFGDAIGALEQASRELGLERFDLGSSETEGFVCSARYTDPGNDKMEAMKTLMAVQRVRREGRKGGFLARAVARGLLGSWVAAGKNADGGIEIVQLSFFPRYPTDTAYDWEYVALRTEGGTTQREIYRYAEATDCLTVWDVEKDGFSTGRLKSRFEFNHDLQEHGKSTAVSVLVPLPSQGEDLDGLSKYRFHFSGSSLKTWTVSKAGRSAAILNFVRIGKA